MTGLPDLVGLSWPGGSPENTGLIIAVVIGAYLAAFWLAGLVWTSRDIRQRSDDPFTQAVAVLIVLVLNLPGWVLYRVLRPTHTLEQLHERRIEEEALLYDLRAVQACPRCGGRVHEDFLACPFCAAQLRSPCPSCERPLEAAWNACPWCSRLVERAAEPAPPPAPTAPVAPTAPAAPTTPAAPAAPAATDSWQGG